MGKSHRWLTFPDVNPVTSAFHGFIDVCWQ
jgi:hypothetical protein